MPFDTSSLSPLASAPAAPNFDLSSLAPLDAGSPSASAAPRAAVPDNGQSTIPGMGSQVAPGLNQFAYDVMGAPVDIARGLINGVTAPTRDAQANAEAAGRGAGTGFAIPEIPSGTVGSSDWWAQQFHNLVGTPIPADVPANGPAERAVRAGVGALATALVPESVFGKVGEVMGAGEKAGTALGEMLGSPSTATGAVRNAATGFVSGAGAQVASDAVPEPYKPVAAIAGGILTGLPAEGVISGIKGAAGAARDYATPFMSGAREAAVGAKIRDAATDPAAAMSSLSEPGEVVPGSVPTTFQQTGDLGLGGLEKARATVNPEPFLQRSADQNAARLAAMNDIQSTGYAEAVPDFLRQQLAGIDQDMEAAQTAATSTARNEASPIAAAPAPEAIGAQIQSPMQGLADAAKARTAALYKAVDPDGTLQGVSAPLKRVQNAVYGNLGPAALIGVTPAERAITGVIADYGPVIPFSELMDVRSQISQAMRDAKSPLQPNDLSYARLSQLRGAVENAISDSVQGKAAQEQQAVAAGAMAPEDTMVANMIRQREGWYAGRQAATGSAGTEGIGANGASGPTTVLGPSGTGSAGPGRPSGDASSPGLSQNAGSGPFVDQGAADRLAAATEAYKARKQAFGAPPVADILRRPGATYPYNDAADLVPAKVWRPGPAGAPTVRSVFAASDNGLKSVLDNPNASPEALATARSNAAQILTGMQNAAAASLRKAAMRDDGTLDSTKFASWKATHAPALAELEKVAPGSTAPYESAAQAAAHADALAKLHKDAVDGYQKSAVGKLLGLTDPGDVVNTVGGMLGKQNSVRLMREVATEVKGNPAAKEGLRRALVQYIEKRVLSPLEAGTSGERAFKPALAQKFLADNREALRQVFTDEEVNTWDAIARDLQRSNRSISATKLPGRSNTAGDRAAVAKHGHKEPTLLDIASHVLGRAGHLALPLAGAHFDGIVGFGAGLGANYAAGLVGSARAAGITKMDDLLTEAMLNPPLARALMAKAPKRPNDGSMRTLARMFRTIVVPGGQKAVSGISSQ